MKLPENKDDVILTIVDAAGVENMFKCEDSETKKQFLNLKHPKETQPYYVKEQYKDLVSGPQNTPLDNKIFSYFGYTKVEDIVIRPPQVGQQDDLKFYLDNLNMLTERINTSVVKYMNPDPNSLNTSENTELVNQMIYDKINKLIASMPIADKSKITELIRINLDFPASNYTDEPFTIRESIRNTGLPVLEFKQGGQTKVYAKSQWMPFAYSKDTLIETQFSKTSWARQIDIYTFRKKLIMPKPLELKHKKTDLGFESIYQFPLYTEALFYPYIDTHIAKKPNIADINSNTNLKNLELLNEAVESNTRLFQYVATIVSDPAVKTIYDQIQTLINYKNLLSSNPNIIRLFLIVKPFQECGLIDDTLSDKDALLYSNDSKDSDNFTSISDKYVRFSDLAEQIKNNVILFFGDIVDRCDERRKEGILINKSLNDMRTSLTNIIKVNQRISLFQSIPLFNSPCLEYYCNPKLYNCFSLEENELKPEEDIFDDIREVYGNEDRVKKLLIVIIGLVNITKTVHNPPPTPYIDLTLLKQIRDQYFTMIQYDNDNLDQLKINQLFEKVRTFWSSYVSPNIDKYRESIGIPFHQEIVDRFNYFNTLPDKYTQLIAFIGILEKLNSITTLGTLDFLQFIKNSLHTDISCNLLALPQPTDMFTEINSYRNIITGKDYVTEFGGATKSLQYVGIGGSKKKLLKKYSKYTKMLKNVI